MSSVYVYYKILNFDRLLLNNFLSLGIKQSYNVCYLLEYSMSNFQFISSKNLFLFSGVKQTSSETTKTLINNGTT